MKVYKMLRIVDIFPVGSFLSITVEGNANMIKNNCKLVDEHGDFHTVLSVCLAKYNNPHDISKYTTFLTEPCSLKKGLELYIA